MGKKSYFCSIITWAFVMDKTKQMMAYYVVCIRCFGERFGLTPKESHAYLDRHAGLQFLMDCYEAEHTLSIEEAVEDMAVVCRRNGRRL